MTDEWLSPKEAARYMNVGVSTLYRWCRQGRLRWYVNEANGRRRFRKADLDALLRLHEPGR